jgi:RNA polymerase sigma-70 factor (ECF subfamily)
MRKRDVTDQLLADRFEEQRGHLRGVAYRMLGSLTEADDAVQEAWLRLSRSSASDIDNLGGWLTTVVARVCLDMLRSRRSRGEERLETQTVEPAAPLSYGTDPEHEALLADSVGLALLVVLDTLTPAERLAFVMHDMFAMSFDEVGRIIRRSPVAARQLASRARRRVHGRGEVRAGALAAQRQVVDAFLAAVRAGDFEGLIAVLDPDVVVRADRTALPPGSPAEIHGAETCARRAIVASRGARAAQPALVDGAVGLVVAPRGRLFRVLQFTIVDRRIAQIDVVGDPARLRSFELAILD